MIKKVLIGILFLLLLLFVFFISNWQLFSNLNSLSDVTLNNISIDGKTYSLKDRKVYEGEKQLFWFIPTQRDTVNKVVSLAGFYMWNKEDPLFNSPDLNVSELKNSVNTLTKEQELHLKAFNQTIPPYPTRFLAQFVKAASLDKDFLKNPSLQKADELIKAQKEAAQLYKKDMLTLRSQIPESSQSAVTPNLQLSSKIVRGDLEKISTNNTSLINELDKREKCLMGKNNCTRPSLSFSKPSTTTPKTNSNPPDALLSPDIIFYARPKRDNKGPYSTTTSCFGWGNNFTKPISYFYLRKTPSTTEDGINNSLYFNIQLATDVIFRKLNTDSITAGEKELFNQGIKYIYNGTTSPYNCPDRTFFADISQLDLFLTTKKPILQDMQLPDLSAKTYEKSFFEQKYPSFQSLSYLANTYEYLYRQMVENPQASWVREILPYKDELLQRSLSIQRKIGNLPLVLNSHTMYIKGLKSRQEIEQKFNPRYIKEFVYTFRNFYGMMFLPFSPSVWRSNNNLEYSEKVYVIGTIDPDGAYISYHQAQKIYSQEEIYSWYLAQKRLSLNFSYFRF